MDAELYWGGWGHREPKPRVSGSRGGVGGHSLGGGEEIRWGRKRHMFWMLREGFLEFHEKSNGVSRRYCDQLLGNG
jgi:hypothetical protein